VRNGSRRPAPTGDQLERALSRLSDGALERLARKAENELRRRRKATEVVREVMEQS
jgi:hypothetical protein